ncbi:hypothetical protein [Candidatus Nitrospira bockiana]
MLLLFLLSGAIVLLGSPHASALTIQQTAVATNLSPITPLVGSLTTAAGQTTISTGILTTTGPTTGSIFTPFPFAGAAAPLIITGGSIFNPFPFAGAAAPLAATNTSVFNPFPFSGAAAPLAGIGGSVFTPFPLSGAAAPLGSTGGASLGTAAARFPERTGGSVRPAASAGPTISTSTTLASTGGASGTPGNASVESTVNVSLLTQVLAPGSLLLPANAQGVGTFSSTLNVTVSPSASLIQNPEPASWVLLATGLTWLLWSAIRSASRQGRSRGDGSG